MDRTFAGEAGREAGGNEPPDRCATTFAAASGPSVEAALRRVMRQVPAAVTIITAQADGVPFGMTATSFTTLSLEPPSVVVAVNRQASIHDCLERQPAFAVNILAGGAEVAARAFATKELTQAQRFASVAWRRHHRGPPMLVGAVATLWCETAERVAYGTHLLLVGRVVDVAGDRGGMALLYADGSFRRLGRERAA